MGLNSARFSGDRILEQCAANTFRMQAPQDSLSVMRVQEALSTLGYDAGTLDGIFGPDTGGAVTAFKIDNNLHPSDPVVGPGTSTALDTALFVDPPSLDPAFGELAPYVAAHVVEPFVGFELNYLVTCPLASLRHEIGFAMLSMLGSSFCLAIVAQSRAVDIPDPRVTADAKNRMANLRGSAITVPFTGTDGVDHVGVAIKDLTIMGRRYMSDIYGQQAVVTLRGALCHELTHVRNMPSDLKSTPDSDSSVFLDTGLAASLSASTGQPTANTLSHFVHEIVASHVEWITIREDANDPFAAQFLPAAALAEAAHYFFAETDLSWFHDNGYMAAFVASGDQVTYRQIALWLRVAAGFTFSDDAQIQETSAQLFFDAADAAEFAAFNPDAPHATADGIYPAPSDFFTPN